MHVVLNKLIREGLLEVTLEQWESRCKGPEVGAEGGLLYGAERETELSYQDRLEIMGPGHTGLFGFC